MKKNITILVFLLCFLSANSQTVREKLISTGAWFLFSSRLEQQSEGDEILTEISFYKKDDVSSLLFEENNRLYSVFSEQGTEMNEDLWKLLDDNNFVIASLTGETSQVMEIMEISPSKLVLRYCDDSNSEGSTCMISTYFSTKAGWLSDAEIDELNSAGVMKLEEMTP
jgi:hypothetical protein